MTVSSTASRAMASESIPQRFDAPPEKKATGATYTPTELADFVAEQMLRCWCPPSSGLIRVLDPAVGDGELLASLVRRMPRGLKIEIHGFDTNREALSLARKRLAQCPLSANHQLHCADFLSLIADGMPPGGLWHGDSLGKFNLIIANPPYVRTQVLGARSAQALSAQFGLEGRVDLYQAFVLAIAQALEPRGVTGIIVSNRFMTTKSGAAVRRSIRRSLRVRRVWDLGDTKIFDAAVLPAVIVAEGGARASEEPVEFTSIYETSDPEEVSASSLTEALGCEGVVSVPGGRRFLVQRGLLPETGNADEVWRVANRETDDWLATVRKNTWATFRDLGKVRVGVKTCADSVFIRRDWGSLPESERPELLRPLTTHHIARRYRASSNGDGCQILYPHHVNAGKRTAVDIRRHPRTLAYLEQHRARLESRKYVLEAGRNWFELWVPQDPGVWPQPKLVFRDISERPCFWIDKTGSVVNGDCYWLACGDPAKEDHLWLAVSIANSAFAESFYDRRFNNKLYAGRRRFITQYVEQFPLLNPVLPIACRIVELAKQAYAEAGSDDGAVLEAEIDGLVWEGFGVEH